MDPSYPHPSGPVIARPGDAPIAASGRSLVLHEWTMPGPSYLRFHLVDRVFDAPAGTSVFVPAGVAHTYSCVVPSRYLIFLTPRMDQLISHLVALTDQSEVARILAEFDTEIVDPGTQMPANVGSTPQITDLRRQDCLAYSETARG
ncbi:hypothetical protein [Paracoccus benzoatiresistens]|uniref:Uncharacterized protein n=1 Tax=Paracoccus benzoatiresistens TaxID=2997341 RepID=A0ABT4J9I9_9RHOB|nr:hypothetical protein [Paracoccus sp. EF6]MCZ0963795.1 hypothetical protein [Paracoccus sp. EF6]